MDKPMTTDDKFLANMRKKHNTKEVDKVKVESKTMEGIMKDVAQVPDKLNMVGSPDGSKHVKSKKEGENPLQTGEGKQILESTMGK